MEKNYKVYLWCGAGYVLDEFNVTAGSEYEALETLTAELIKNEGARFYLTESEMIADIEAGYATMNEFEEVDGWLYVDATMQGAPYPVWIRSENLKILEAA